MTETTTIEATPKIYQTPELIDYGPIEVLTQAAGGTPTDGLVGSTPT